jgi:acyl transferase domain-containing protein/acyl carrier protein
MKTRSIKKDIAIIGISGKFPKSDNITEFWKNLVEGNEMIHFYSDEELHELDVHPNLIQNKNYIKSSAFLNEPGSFDYSFFGYTKEEAELMDPQTRILHEQAWLALEDAGCNSFNYPGKIGCFVTASDNLDWRAHVKLFENNTKVNPFLIEQICNQNTMSMLVSYSLNLKGPSYFVDTACSSSLVAIHIACRSLLMKECSMALAGGVSVSSSINIGYVYESGMTASKDGHCKAFDIDSSGTVGGEGVGIIVLKRLEDALNDRDHIYSIIRSSSVNNDGNRKIGYTAPSIIGQYECIRTAHQIAEVEPKSISYIETHGTGTKLGDSVEIEALNKAFNYDTTHQCSIGSLKTNLGHLDAAAGVAGLIKTALSLKHNVIPASLHFTAPNPEINFTSGPFIVNAKLKEWVAQKPLLAGVSSLGIGGTNAHIILEEPLLQQKGSTSVSHQLIAYSAKTKSSLERYETKLKEFIQKNKNIDLPDLAYTLKTGRNNYKYRKFIVCKDVDELEQHLNEVNLKEPSQIKEKRSVVFMFSGQGSQYYNMGKQIYFQYPYFKSLIDEGFEILKKETGTDYADIIGYNETNKADKDLINDTYFTQPLLFLLEYAFAKLLIKFGVKPAAMIGHSLGEYVAACISGVFSFEEGLRLIVKRAELMGKVERGAMLSVECSAAQIKELIPFEIDIAAINTDGSCVVSGNNDNIHNISETLLSKEISFAKLKTSHAFHSQMMDSILSEYENELNKIKFSEPSIPFISCSSGILIKKEEAVSPKYWVEHLRKTVSFSKGLNSLLAADYSTYIEIGPGKTLINFLRQSKSYKPDSLLLTVLRHPKETTNDAGYLLNTLGSLWSKGIDINWNEYYSAELRNKISAPGYSFDKIIFPAKINPVQKFIEMNALNPAHEIKNDYREWIYEQGWKEIKNESSDKQVYEWTVCFLDNNYFSEALKSEIRKEEENIIFVKPGSGYINQKDNTITINAGSLSDYEKLVSDISNKYTGAGRIIHAWNAFETVPATDHNSEVEDSGYFSLLNIARTFSKEKRFTSIKIDFLVSGLFKVNGNEFTEAAKSTVLAALKIIPKEFENFKCRCIEFLIKDFENNIEYRNNFFKKLKNNSDAEVNAIRGNKAWKPFYEKIEVDKNVISVDKLKKHGLYIITGANGGMGKTISEYLANEYEADLILIGRSELNSQALSVLKKGNGKVQYIKDDLSDLDKLKTKINSAIAIFSKKVNGVFHTAGLGDYSGLIADRSKKDCLEIFLPKIKGTNNLFNSLKDDLPEFFVLCSSSSSTLSPFGQVAYVAANLYQNFFAQQHNSKTKIISIQWDAWKEAGMALKASNRHGNNNEVLPFGISNQQGIELFKYALSSKSSEFIVSIHDFNSQLSHINSYTLKKAMESADAVDDTIDGEVERPNLESFYKEPVSETEKMLCDLWRSIFGYEKIGINDDFFELGGDSLKVMTIIKKIHKTFNIEISIGDFFKKNTIEELAKEIDLANDLKSLSNSVNQPSKSNQIRL